MDPSGRDDVHVCELCGAWFETRKGLSSHARAHLRTFGIESAEAKGAPIDTLHKFMISKGLKPGSSNAMPSEVKKEESAQPISAKRPAPSSPCPKTPSKGPASASAPLPSSAKRFKSSSSSSSSSAEGLSLRESPLKDDEAPAKSGEFLIRPLDWRGSVPEAKGADVFGNAFMEFLWNLFSGSVGVRFCLWCFQE